MCKPCVNWKFEATETWGLRFEVTAGEKHSLNEHDPIHLYTMEINLKNF